MVINFISSRHTDEKLVMHSKIKQENSIKDSNCTFDCGNLLRYKYKKI